VGLIHMCSVINLDIRMLLMYLYIHMSPDLWCGLVRVRVCVGIGEEGECVCW